MTTQEIDQKAEEMSQVIFDMQLSDSERDEHMTEILDEVVTTGESFTDFLNIVMAHLKQEHYV